MKEGDLQQCTTPKELLAPNVQKLGVGVWISYLKLPCLSRSTQTGVV